MSTEQSNEDSMQIPISWVGTDELPLQFANQFLTTTEGHTSFFMLGSLQPPPIIGTPEQQRAQAEQISFIPVKPIARVALSLQSLKELQKVVDQAVENAERILKEQGE